uniref:NADH:ubiquinone oxidoreductase subunit V3 n=1 Tax=Lepisosteus oculatus TaxID=7918 RepID=W5M8D3_LEPOC|nr:PREDICTED: NADH dehydrogenase [ubiquinone] flavoprotein 3, mitochondrial [Lepisosteus oculatus]XP_015219086.1 PREDICTED: NADH dehydrogenase [ubiquinone] flavoprotein 3, mitochondrial [Lepisosteus oculatus]XP_015219087.1 PREDICTED: NADH dehydrogenase [ubiquinone] flavoprotein 3, mitochondrial [Lepisosteus oculatus]XP_015219088.1 PREDICTED: NADH dehydrogenase [ubiquinone] flavoprotein 3, mitochondrial [Lepisosteus oculatus]XP_015219089.1 PREDICTED: NADH dehydrogenase [ubiquinone] flavoprotein 
MAASILRLGQARTVKCLHLETWAFRRTAPSASFCTKPEVPKKGGKKNVVSPEERAALLSSRTTVGFPAKVFPPIFISPEAVGKHYMVAVSSEAVNTELTHKATVELAGAPSASVDADFSSERARLLQHRTCINFPKRGPWPVLDGIQTVSPDPAVSAVWSKTAGCEAEIEETSSSSTSDSDSDSDSDGEEDRIEVHVGVKGKEPLTTWLAGGAVKGSPTPHSTLDEPLAEEKKTLADTDIAQTAGDVSILSHRESHQGQTEDTGSSLMAESTDEPDKIIVVGRCGPRFPEQPGPKDMKQGLVPTIPKFSITTEQGMKKLSQSEIVFDIPVSPHDSGTEASPEAKPADTIEVLADLAPVTESTAVEGSLAETMALAGAEDAQQETMTPTPGEPEFDNTTYKNTQHYQYTPYTFTDYDVEMAKYRLPQPSSGRPSPRH